MWGEGMNEQEYLDKVADVNKRAEFEKRELKIKFAFSHQEYNVGDIINNGSLSIIIDRVQAGINFASDLPECVYGGFVLKKDLKPRKDKERGTIYQGDVKRSGK